MRFTLLLAAAAVVLLGSAAFAAGGRLAPLEPADAVSTHGPFEMGACDACHQGQSTKPGAKVAGHVVKPAPELCFDCHDDFRKPVKNHPAAKTACTACHSPHNARKKKLLL
ncbi:MAG TPA: cytochrome c3 family protein [Anaeromyxobacteraceae bacterium]|nr:cytochrome c3 family protein [Anaeromyxobacteraceae bacterium]